MNLTDDPEFHLEVGVDIAARRWSNSELCTTEELRELGREQVQNPIPGHNAVVRQLEEKHPMLQKRAARR